jgi:flagellar biosynthesis regulator FlbT
MYIYRPSRRADQSSKEVVASVLIRSRNLQCEAAKTPAKTVEPLVMMMIIDDNDDDVQAWGDEKCIKI